MALLKSNLPAGEQKIFTRENVETRKDERMIGEKRNTEMNPKYSK